MKKKLILTFVDWESNSDTSGKKAGVVTSLATDYLVSPANDEVKEGTHAVEKALGCDRYSVKPHQSKKNFPK